MSTRQVTMTKLMSDSLAASQLCGIIQGQQWQGCIHIVLATVQPVSAL
jgi:hypothetical protein